jgi:hypothetical protein
MEEIRPLTGTDLDERADDGWPMARVHIGVGLVLAVLILVAVAIYAWAFIMLAPMMQ